MLHNFPKGWDLLIMRTIFILIKPCSYRSWRADSWIALQQSFNSIPTVCKSLFFFMDKNSFLFQIQHDFVVLFVTVLDWSLIQIRLDCTAPTSSFQCCSLATWPYAHTYAHTCMQTHLPIPATSFALSSAYPLLCTINSTRIAHLYFHKSPPCHFQIPEIYSQNNRPKSREQWVERTV